MKAKASISRSLALVFALTIVFVGTSAAQTEKSLYERLGGVFAIAQVVDHFSDALIKNPIVGKNSKNPALRDWHRNSLNRLPGLKFMRTLWVCEVSGGPYKFVATKPGSTPLGLENAHKDLKISPAEFDEVAAELGRTLDFAKVPAKEKGEVLAAFAVHKAEVTAGSSKPNSLSGDTFRAKERRIRPRHSRSRACAESTRGNRSLNSNLDWRLSGWSLSAIVKAL